jgi:peptidoglycan lytic transglycosylase G
VSDDWLGGDPFADAEDPAAREREQRRREREEKRRQKAAKQAEAEQQQPPPPAEPPRPLRTPEQEFWGEEPAPAPVATESRLHDEGEPAMAGAARTGRRHSDSGGGGHGLPGRLLRHPFRIAAVVLALLVLWFLNALFQPFHGDGSGRVQVTIPKGSSVSEVGDLLDQKGVIDSSTLFQVRVTLAGKRSEIYSGRFTLADGMSYGAAIDALSTPPLKHTVAVTIPEGYTRSQAAQLVEEDGVPGSYMKATVRSRYLNPAKYGGKGAKDLEGFLFPDTFELKPKAPAADLVQLQLQDFKRRIKKVDMAYAKSKNLTVFDVLIIASMIEREAGVPGQRRLVASVIYNRLHEGMPLGIDATIRFATGNYTRPLTESELATDSPYNTRTNAGLPPGPIDSPGLEAIQAAAHPAKTGYLYYVTTPGECGKLTFAKTEAEFEAAVEKYETAREEAGGQSPDSCGE